ncbi:MAG: maleylacetoacetate isomerase [Polyangiaceae bacterium]|nr:maleylacetoacetate isomerase [Polyangiaceae bacterium]
MKLFGYWRSSCTWRVRIGLNLKGIAYEYVPTHLVRNGGEQFSEAFRKLNPHAQVPLLVVEDQTPPFCLGQSVAILEYLEERYPEPSLLPKTPEARARCRQIAEVVNSGIQPLQNLSVLNRLQAENADAQGFARHFIELGLRSLEALASAESGPFFLDETPTFADLFLVPQLYNARRFQIDLRPFSRLLAIEQACEALPAFQAAHPSVQPDVEA